MKIRRLTVTAVLVAAASLSAAAPAVATPDSPVSGPPVPFSNVQPAGTPCDFAVQLSGMIKEAFLEVPPKFIQYSPALQFTLTNLQTGATYTPHGDAIAALQEFEDGTFVVTQTGASAVWPGLGMLTTGTFSRTFYPDGSASELTGHGSMVSYCDLLS